MGTRNSHAYDISLFEKLVPKYRYDGREDVRIWQKRAYARLWDRLGMDRMQRAQDDAFAVTAREETQYGLEIDFTYESEPGYEVPGFVILPRNVKNPPAAICIQGHSTGMHISRGRRLFPDDERCFKDPDRMNAVIAAGEGYAAFAIEQRYMGVCGHNEERKVPGCVVGQALPPLLLGRTAIGERVWDVMRLIDVIETHFTDVDPEGIVCLGNSGGGTTTFYSACIDERIAYAMPCCSVCNYYESIVLNWHCACNYIPGIATDFDMGDLAGLIAPRGLVVINGSEDGIFPPDGVDRMFAKAQEMYGYFGAAGKCEHFMGTGGHRFYAQGAWDALKRIKAREKEKV